MNENKAFIKVNVYQSDPVGDHATLDSEWAVQRLLSLNTAGRSLLGIHSIVDLGFLTNHVLDPSLSCLSTETYGSNPMCPKEGIKIIDGPYNCGKTRLISKVVETYYNCSESLKQEDVAAKEKLKNLKKYSIAELLAEEDSEDEEMTNQDKMKQFPWF